MDIEHQLQPK